MTAFAHPKILFLILDGLGDRPIPEFGGKTPLEAAATPNLDSLAGAGITGLLYPLGRGRRPGSDVAHLSLFGYDPAEYYSGRGPIEVRGLGIPLQDGDVALRGNLGTLDENGVIKDRRAGRISDVTGLVAELDGLVIDDVTFIVKPGTAHRAGIVLRGAGLSSNITDSDPHHENVEPWLSQPRDDSAAAKRTAGALNAFLVRATEILKLNSINAERGEFPANCVLVRGAGQYVTVPTIAERYHGLKSCCIAGGGLYKGIGSFLGMDLLSVAGATGQENTDLEAKFRRALDARGEYDIIFLHIKATDTRGHDGDFAGKKDFIEKIDRFAQPLLAADDSLIVLTGDHSTPCALKDHSVDPVPLLAVGPGITPDSVDRFGERPCMAGGLGHCSGLELMPMLMGWIGLTDLEGA